VIVSQGGREYRGRRSSRVKIRDGSGRSETSQSEVMDKRERTGREIPGGLLRGCPTTVPKGHH